MTNKEKNEAIAVVLGFEKRPISVNGIPNSDHGWIAPDEFRYFMVASPMRDVPDFIKLIHNNKDIKDIINGFKI